jgi:hypothetical protein
VLRNDVFSISDLLSLTFSTNYLVFYCLVVLKMHSLAIHEMGLLVGQLHKSSEEEKQ